MPESLARADRLRRPRGPCRRWRRCRRPDWCRMVLPVARAADRGRGNSHGPRRLRHSACAHPQGGPLRLPLGPRGPVRASCLASCEKPATATAARRRGYSGPVRTVRSPCRAGWASLLAACLHSCRQPDRVRHALRPRGQVLATARTVPPVARAADRRPSHSGRCRSAGRARLSAACRRALRAREEPRDAVDRVVSAAADESLARADRLRRPRGPCRRWRRFRRPDWCRTVLPVARAADRGRRNSHGPRSLRPAYTQGGR